MKNCQGMQADANSNFRLSIFFGKIDKVFSNPVVLGATFLKL
jgi:hypothetical protein